MTINIFTLTSPIHNKKAVADATARWLGAIEKITGQGVLVNHEDNYSSYGTADLSLIYIRTGGTEGLFKKLFSENEAVRNRKVLLLTSGSSNSLAASMEILSWLRGQGKEARILHGTAEYVGRQMMLLAGVEAAKAQLRGKKIGVIGKPSDWLISSDYDAQAIQQKLGVGIEEISMTELLEEIRRRDYPVAARKRIKTCPSDYFIGALEIYGALRRLVDKHNLSGLTLRCFDLLTSVKNTGCLALALLNQEGIPSGCEGDVPALVTMMICHALTQQTGFQANPSRINPENDECVFAHCTIPLNMITSYDYDTHFESGIGVAIKGKMPTGLVTLLKVSGDLKRHYAAQGLLIENMNDTHLCRTQVKISLPGSAGYFLNDPIGNHHIIVSDSQKLLFDTFMKSL